MIRHAAAAFAAALLAAGAACAQDSAPFDAFLGEWTSDGDAFGGPAESVMTWEPALADQFVRLTYRIEMHPTEERGSVFRGVAFYRVGSGAAGTFDAFWADNTGDLHPIVAERGADFLVANWGVEGVKQGRTRYELIGENEMEVTDFIRVEASDADASWRQFNHNVFHRIPEDEVDEE